MARTEARIRCSIWKDDDYRSLSGWAQWLYEAILSQSDLSQCGVITWAPKRFAGLAKDATPTIIRKARDELRARRYVVVDDDTDELWVRTFVRNDGILESPNLIIAMSHDFGAIHSTAIREGLVEGLGEGFLEGLSERFKKPLPDGYRERLAKPFVEALVRPREGGRTPPRSRVPQTPNPTTPNPKPANTDPPRDSIDAAGIAEEEDHPGQEPDPETLVCQLVAQRRYAKRSADQPEIPEGIRRDSWLTTVADQVRTTGAQNIHALLAGGLSVEQIVDTFEPPERPIRLVSPYPVWEPPAEDVTDPAVALAHIAEAREAQA